MGNYQNLIRGVVTAFGMSPEGIIAGAIGAGILVFYGVNGKMSLRFKIGVVASAGTLCGYLFRVLEEYLKFDNSLSWFLCMILGFSSPYFFRRLKVIAPAVFTAAGKRLQKKIIDENATNGGDPD